MERDTKDKSFLYIIAPSSCFCSSCYSCALFPFLSQLSTTKSSTPSLFFYLPIECWIAYSAMATCRSLKHIFENPFPEKSTLLESLPLCQIKPIKPVDQNSFTEIFGELHFKESPDLSPASSFSSSSSSSSIDLIPEKDILRTPQTINHRSRESLQLCTEGLGFESSDDVEELKSEVNESWETHREKMGMRKEIPLENSNGEYCRRSRVSGGEYPPPISCIGRNGKPWVYFKSYRNNGRFVLKEIRIPTQEFLHAYRENGRLKLNFVQPDDEFQEEDAEEDEEDYNDDGHDGACETDEINEEKESDL